MLPVFLSTLGYVYEKADRPELYPKMRDTFLPAVKRYPSDPRMHLYLGVAYAGMNDNLNARNALRTAIALARPDAKTLLDPKERADTLADAEKAYAALGDE
jgi:hypothetical protein